jgi:hypothetical protein
MQWRTCCPPSAMACLAQIHVPLLAHEQAIVLNTSHSALRYTLTHSWIGHHTLLRRLSADQAIHQEEDDPDCALPCINISNKISIVEPYQHCLISLLPIEPEPLIASVHHIAENPLHRCKVIHPWLL